MATPECSPPRERITTCKEIIDPSNAEENDSSSLELKYSEKIALLELRSTLERAIRSNHFRATRILRESKSFCTSDRCYVDLRPREAPEDISLWGIPLLPSKGHEGTDTVLIKFLRAADFKSAEAFRMLKRTLQWRRKFRVDGILEEDFGPDLDNLLCFDSTDRDGHPLCYYKYGAFGDKGLFQNIFGTFEGRERLLRWRVQSMEKGIRKLSFSNGGVCSLVQITDMKNAPGHAIKEVLRNTRKSLVLLHDYYPEIISRNIIINVPFSCYLYRALFPNFLPQKMRSKCIFVRPRKVAETLLKYIAPESIPIEYGGFQRENDYEFVPGEEKIGEMTVRCGTKIMVEIPVLEAGVTVVWDMIVVGWEVSYKEEFIPEDECSYKILIQKEKKMEASVRNSFYINEPGKVVLTVENPSFKKKKLLYRFKTKPTMPLYNFFI